MKLIYIVFAFFFLVLGNETVTAQRKVLSEEEEVIAMVTSEMDQTFQDKDFTQKKHKKFAEVTGTMVIDISVIQNGKVATFFKVDSDIKNIDFINFMSEYILNHKFQFKLPKQQRFKIRYTITF